MKTVEIQEETKIETGDSVVTLEPGDRIRVREEQKKRESRRPKRKIRENAEVVAALEDQLSGTGMDQLADFIGNSSGMKEIGRGFHLIGSPITEVDTDEGTFELMVCVSEY